MRARIIAVLAAIPVLLMIKKALEALAIIPILSQGTRVAAQGGDITPYLLALFSVLIAIMLPLGLIQAAAEG